MNYDFSKMHMSAATDKVGDHDGKGRRFEEEDDFQVVAEKPKKVVRPPREEGQADGNAFGFK